MLGRLLPDIADDGALFRAAEVDDAVFHHRIPETLLHGASGGLVCVGQTMQHQAKRNRGSVVVSTGALAKGAGFYVTLTFPCTEEDVPPPAAFQHSLGDGVVLVFVPVLRKVRACSFHSKWART